MGNFRSRIDSIPVLVFAAILFAFSGVPAVAQDSSGGVASFIAQGAHRLKEESVQLVAAPVDTETGGYLTTLAVAGAVGLTYVFDGDIRDKVQANKGRTLDTAADVGSAVGHPLLHLGIAAAVYGGGTLAESRKWQETGEMLGEAALLADAAGFLLKSATGRARPFVTGDKGDFRPFQFRSDYDAFPSLHTASSFAMASVMAATSETVAAKILYYSAATFVGFSRMYEDKHWASDVVLGAALGELCGRVVTGYHVRGEGVALVPLMNGESVVLSLQGKW